MSLQDHIAIITHSSLAEAVPNTKKLGNPLQYYAKIAFPPEAANELAELAKSVAPGGNLTSIAVSARENGKSNNAIPGIPSNWLVLRASTQYAPAIVSREGERLDQETQKSDIRATFYPGRRVRAILSAYTWNYDKTNGISFNLVGVMDAGEGERMNIGSDVITTNAFAQYAEKSVINEVAQPPVTVFAASPSNNPFQQAAHSNPFA